MYPWNELDLLDVSLNLLHHWSQTSVKMAFFSILVSFTDSKKVITWWQILGEVSLCSCGRSLFASLLRFALSSKTKFKINRYRLEFERCKIHYMNTNCLELAILFRNLQQLCCCQEMLVITRLLVWIRDWNSTDVWDEKKATPPSDKFAKY